MEFSDSEKARIKRFLSYPDWVALAQSIQLGFPAGSQPLFLVEDAFGRLTDEAKDLVRTDLCECEDIERQMSEARRRLKAKKLGELHLNPRELAQLKRELLYWVTRLADDLGVVANPYSQMMYERVANMGGIGASVSG